MEYESDMSFGAAGSGSSDDEEMLVSMAAGHVADLAGRDGSGQLDVPATPIATQQGGKQSIAVEEFREEFSRPDRPLEPAYQQERPRADKRASGATEQRSRRHAAVLKQVAVVLGALAASALIYWLW